jgi:hypothetical protein
MFLEIKESAEMTFALWDLETGNLVAAYDTEALALAVVREAVQAYGPGYVEPLALVRETSRGRSRLLAEGAALAEHAFKAPRSATTGAPREQTPRSGVGQSVSA